MSEMIKAVVFDLDGTLGGRQMGSGLFLKKLHGELAERFPGLSFGEAAEFLNKYRDINVQSWGAWVRKELLLDADGVKVHIFEQFLLSYGLDAEEAKVLASDVNRRFLAEYPDDWHPATGAVDVLRWVKEQGLATAVVSNGEVEEQTEKLRSAGMLPYLDHLFFSRGVGYSKPDVRFFEHAIRALGCQPEEAVMIGDSWRNDIEPAEQLGMTGIRIYEDAPVVGLPDGQSVADLRDVVERLAEAIR